MADEEQLRILKQGVQAWNAWRSQAGDIRIDLRTADLRATELRTANLNFYRGDGRGLLACARVLRSVTIEPTEVGCVGYRCLNSCPPVTAK